MSSIFYFGPTDRKMSVADWKDIQADGAPPGTYETNMTAKFRNMWKGKISGIKSGSFKIEIRRIIRGVNPLMTVHGKSFVAEGIEVHRSWKRVDPSLADGDVTIAMNGTLTLSFPELLELTVVLGDARKVIEELERSDKVQQKAIIAALEAMEPT